MNGRDSKEVELKHVLSQTDKDRIHSQFTTIESLIKSHTFDTKLVGGTRSIIFSDGTKKDVPATVAVAYTAMIDEKTKGKPIEAVAKFYAIMSDAYLNPHGGRTKSTHEFYALMAGDRLIKGENIFGDDHHLADVYDEAFESFAAEQAWLRTSNVDYQKYAAFQHSLDTEQNNLKELKNDLTDYIHFIADEAKDFSERDQAVIREGGNFLVETMNRLLLAVTKEDVEKYKKDFLEVAGKLLPDNKKGAEKKLKTSLGDFCNHHLTMMTDLNDKKKELGKIAFLTVVAIGAGAASPMLGGLAHLPATVATPHIGQAIEKGISLSTKTPEDLKPSQSMPSIPRPETRSEKVLRYISTAETYVAENKITLGLAVGGLISGLLFPPLAIPFAVAGIGNATARSGRRFNNSYDEFKNIEELAKRQGVEHEQDYAQLMIKLSSEKNPRVEKWLKEQKHMSYELTTPSSAASIHSQLAKHPAGPMKKKKKESPTSDATLTITSTKAPETSLEEASPMIPKRNRKF